MTAAAHIAAALGGRRAQRLADGSFLVPCPVPSHGKGRGDRNPSLRIGDGETRVLVYCYGGCDRVSVLDELCRRGLLDDRPARRTESRSPKPQASDDYVRRQHQKAAYLWSRRQRITGTIAEKYLRTRAITCELSPTLGFLPAREPEHHPALIVAFALVDEPEPGVLGTPHDVNAVHLTLLKPDGTGKAEIERPKLIVGRPLGRPLVVAPVNDGLGLAITEGLEDALSVHLATGLGAWAAGSASMMPSVADNMPDYVTCVSIFVDANTAGRRHSHELAVKLRQRKSHEGERAIEVILRELRDGA
jgi:hypothetical protein